MLLSHGSSPWNLGTSPRTRSAALRIRNSWWVSRLHTVARNITYENSLRLWVRYVSYHDDVFPFWHIKFMPSYIPAGFSVITWKRKIWNSRQILGILCREGCPLDFPLPSRRREADMSNCSQKIHIEFQIPSRGRNRNSIQLLPEFKGIL